MANQGNNQQLSGWDKVVAWYASKAYAVGIVYSVGASVVIIGALFKILHWPGASYVLMLGMFTEAFLFIIGIFEKPHAAYNWENVFPQLIGHDAQPLEVGGAKAASAPSLGGFDAADTKALKESIANMAATANGFAEINKVAENSKNLNAQLVAATEAAGKFAGAQAGVADAAAALGTNYQAAAQAAETLKADAEAAAKSQAAVAQNIAAINAAYEVSVKAAQSCADSTNAYAAAQAQLAKQVADLNKVYGNMLNAIA